MSVSGGSSNGYTSSDSGKLFSIEERFECPICLTCLKRPLLTSCGHKFCQKCIEEWLKKEGSCCPIDGTSLTPDKDLFPDNFTRREIDQHAVQCPYTDCQKKLFLSEFERHLADVHEKQGGSSKNGMIPCSYQSIGCTLEFQSNSLLISHIQNNMELHLQLLSAAYNRLSSKLENAQPESIEHWDAPAKGSQLDLQSLVKSMYERIVALEQKGHEQDIHIMHLKDKIQVLTLENSSLRKELPLRVCGGVLIWNVPNITSKINDMNRDKSVMIYSDAFYTAYKGYKVCGRLNISPRDTDYLSLLIHFMKGENDHALDWPFSGKICFTLIHPTEQEKNLKEAMWSRPELEAFQRPLKLITSRAFGYTEFILITDLMSQGFISSDGSINIKIEVGSV